LPSSFNPSANIAITSKIIKIIKKRTKIFLVIYFARRGIFWLCARRKARMPSGEAASEAANLIW